MSITDLVWISVGQFTLAFGFGLGILVGWYAVAIEAIGRIGECRYFKTPMTLIQFVKPGWAHKVLGGSFDTPKGSPQRGGDFADAPAPRPFTGETAEAFERTRRKLAASKEAIA